MTDALPSIGMYLRPVGLLTYGYCYRVLRHVAPTPGINDFPGVECERWGIDRTTTTPIDDGHVKRGHYIDLIPSVTAGAWRDRQKCTDDGSGWCLSWAEPLYYRRMDADSDGQADLFA